MVAGCRKGVLGVTVALLIGACTSRPAIVADPPESEQKVPEALRLEEEYERAMMKSQMEALPAAEDSDHDENVTRRRLGQSEEGGILEVVADVMAAPFRAVGWLFQAIF